MGAGDPSQYLLNEKIEYNRCLVPDIMELETPDQSQALLKVDEENIKIKKTLKRR